MCASPVLTSRAPRRQTEQELRDLQRLALSTIIHPLAPSGDTQRTFTDGRPMAAVAAEFIKPNERLTSVERLAIYNRQYWYRILDCFYDDYPGLRAILGESRFDKLRVAYLTRHPSRSFTLRNLGNQLVAFLTERPQYTKPFTAMCLDMARFEWAQIVAFDGEAKPALAVDDLLGKDPARLRLGVQPYLSLLELDYPLDDFVLAVKRQDSAMRSEASNAMEEQAVTTTPSRVRRPRPQKVFLAVHRYDNALYYKRLDQAAYHILCALRDGSTLAEACAAAIEADDDPAGNPQWIPRIQEWFSAWTEIGWFCRRSNA